MNSKYWKLTLPVDSKGLFSGGATEIMDLATYQRPPYFEQTPSGELSFAVPVAGATTSGSKYPRCELREMDGNGKEVAWGADEEKYLSGIHTLTEMPVKADGTPGRVVIAQIHGKKDELCRLYYDNGKVYFINDLVGAAKKETTFQIATGIELGQDIAWSIWLKSRSLVVRCNGKSVNYILESHWLKDRFYFKAGLYCQVGKAGSGAGTIGTGVAKGKLRALFLDSAATVVVPTPIPNNAAAKAKALDLLDQLKKAVEAL